MKESLADVALLFGKAQTSWVTRLETEDVDELLDRLELVRPRSRRPEIEFVVDCDIVDAEMTVKSVASSEIAFSQDLDEYEDIHNVQYSQLMVARERFSRYWPEIDARRIRRRQELRYRAWHLVHRAWFT